MKEEATQYPIDSRCKDCSLFQVVEELKKETITFKNRYETSIIPIQKKYLEKKKDTRKGYLIYFKRNQTKEKKKRENYGILWYIGKKICCYF